MILAVAFILAALLVGLSKLPAVTNTEKMEDNLGAFSFKQVRLGMMVAK